MTVIIWIFLQSITKKEREVHIMREKKAPMYLVGRMIVLTGVKNYSSLSATEWVNRRKILCTFTICSTMRRRKKKEKGETKRRKSHKKP